MFGPDSMMGPKPLLIKKALQF